MIILLAAACTGIPALAEAGDPAGLLVTWTDADGAEVTAAVQQQTGESGVYYAVEIPRAELPALSVFLVADADDQPALTALMAEYYGEAADEAHIFQLTDGTEGGLSLSLRVYLSPPPPAEADETLAASDESEPVTVIAHFRTPDGETVAPDDTYQAARGTAYPVYSKMVDSGWISLSGPVQYVDIPEDAGDTVEVTFLFTQPTPTPAPPSVKVTVHYRDVGGVPVASDTYVTCPGGTVSEIRAEPADLKENYYPTSESVQQVSAGSDGKPLEIIFFYTYRAPATPAPAYAIVRYLNAEGEAVAQDGSVSGSPGQEMTIYAAPEQLMDYYVLDGEETQRVTLPQDGETVTVTFVYRLELPQTPPPTATPVPEATATPQPAPVVGFVQVSYVYQGNESLDYSEPVSVYEGQTVLNGADGLRTGYRLISAEMVEVSLDAEGNVTPNSVTFRYAPESYELEMPELIVQYFAENGTQVATSTLLQLHLGENTVYASPVDLFDGYEQITPSYTVTVNEQGEADQAVVTFYYRQTRSEEETAGYQVEPASGYARPNNDSVNLRSEPSTASDSNIIGKIRKTDLIQILGTATNGGKWYYVSVNERQGYVSAGVVTVLSDRDAQVLLSMYNIDSGDSDTPVDPDTGLIERWAQVNKKVWMRAAAGGKKLRELKKGTRVFVDEAVDDDGTLWYRVRYNGKEGFIMAEFLTLYSAAESQSLQFSLPSPVPTHTVPATRVPTSTPTAFIPTPTPTAPPVTPAPVMTETPLPYSGYAVTSARATVRSGLSIENPALVTLNGETLVMVQGQTYVDGVCWDSIRVITTGVTGFIEDDRLFHVTNEVALEYLEIQATATPIPTPETTPVPFTGYAVIRIDGTPLRQQMNSNAQYLSILNAGSVVSVLSQSTSNDGASWCLVQSGMYLGYVRRDMLDQMSDEQIFSYLESIRSRPTPTPAITATPRAQSAMASCWGIIKRDRVNLRSQPSMTEGTALRLMGRNEFVQVQGSFLGEDEMVWQQVMVGGQTGYIRADYIQILTQGELTSVVTSDDFKSANTTETTVTGADSIQSYETYLVNQWTYPSLSASYEPFDPYTTPAAVIAAQVTEPPRTPNVTMPPTPEATIIVNPDRTSAPNAAGGISPGGVLWGAGALAVGGGAYFVWHAYRGKKKREALQRAQSIRRRQQHSEAEPAETRPREYKRDAASGFAMHGTARPDPVEEYEREAPEEAVHRTRVVRTVKTESDDQYSRFSRPEAPEVREAPMAAPEQPAAETPATVARTDDKPVRRRRTERNHYDEDGN